jgi:hypothetical protein
VRSLLVVRGQVHGGQKVIEVIGGWPGAEGRRRDLAFPRISAGAAWIVSVGGVADAMIRNQVAEGGRYIGIVCRRVQLDEQAGVFINYRTGDGDEAAALIGERLSDRFGAELVFRRAPLAVA